MTLMIFCIYLSSGLFFSKVSVQILSIFYGVIHFLIIEFESSLYIPLNRTSALFNIGHWSYVESVICKYFSPYLWLVFLCS